MNFLRSLSTVTDTDQVFGTRPDQCIFWSGSTGPDASAYINYLLLNFFIGYHAQAHTLVSSLFCFVSRKAIFHFYFSFFYCAVGKKRYVLHLRSFFMLRRYCAVGKRRLYYKTMFYLYF